MLLFFIFAPIALIVLCFIVLNIFSLQVQSFDCEADNGSIINTRKSNTRDVTTATTSIVECSNECGQQVRPKRARRKPKKYTD